MNPAHLHLILNHLPVVGVMFGLGILTFGIWKRSEEIKRLALFLLAITAFIAVPAYLTGEPAEGAVKGVPGVAGNLVERHEEAAGVALGGALALGAFAVAGLVAFRHQRPIARWFGVMALLGAFIVSGLMAWTANLGGQVHHPEIRDNASPSSAVKRPQE